jgi:RHS repeat-associated protein
MKANTLHITALTLTGFQNSVRVSIAYENGKLKMILTDNGYIQDGAYYFYTKDHLGNNRITADQNGDLLQSTQYYPFGMSFADTDKPEAQPYKYNGKELDNMNGLNWYDYSARHYDPVIGRFTTIDPLAEDYYDISPYAFALNNPLRYTDPTGMGANDTITCEIQLPEVEITAQNYTYIGTRVMDPVSGFWGWLGYCAFGRTYESNVTIHGTLLHSYWNVGSDGIITGLQPLTGTIDVSLVGKVGTFLKLRQLAKGLGLEVHHLAEVRHLKLLFKSTGKAPAVILTKAEHQALTKELQRVMPYGKPYTKTEIIEKYTEVYKNQSEWLKMAIDYLTAP